MLFLFLSLNMLPWNSASGGFPYIWQSKLVGITAIKTERTQIDFLNDVPVAVASLDLKVPIESAQALFNLLEVFKNLSGLVINSSKTEGMWIGSSRDKTSKPFGIKWPDEPVKALGVYFSYDIWFCTKKFYWEIGQCQKTYKHLTQHLVFKRSFYLWKSNNYQLLNHTKIYLHFLAYAGPQGNR